MDSKSNIDKSEHLKDSKTELKDPENLENIEVPEYKKYVYVALVFLAVFVVGFYVSYLVSRSDPKIEKFQAEKGANLVFSADEDFLPNLKEIPLPPLKELKTTNKSVAKSDEIISHAVQMLFRSAAVRKIIANSDIYVNFCEKKLDELKKDPEYIKQQTEYDEKNGRYLSFSSMELVKQAKGLESALTTARGLSSCFALLQSIPSGLVNLNFDQNTKAFRELFKAYEDPEFIIYRIYDSFKILIPEKQFYSIYAHYVDEGEFHRLSTISNNIKRESRTAGFEFKLKDCVKRKIIDLVHSFFTEIQRVFYFEDVPTEHFKTSTLKYLPATVSLHLDQYSGQAELITDSIEVAHEIDFAPYFCKESLDKFGKNTIYKLKRFITRDGKTQEDSIYTSYIEDVDGIWYKIKQGNVEKVQMNDSITSKGYYFVYEQIKK